MYGPMGDTVLKSELGRLKELWDSGHPDRKGIWMGYEDHILEECLERIDSVIPTTTTAPIGRIVQLTVPCLPTEPIKTTGQYEVVKFNGGASRSERKPDYSLVNKCAIEAIASRMTEGMIKHGRNNYRSGDADFVLETANHLLEHVMNFIAGDRSDNHLNAIGANFNILCWYRENRPETLAPFDDNQPAHGA